MWIYYFIYLIPQPILEGNTHIIDGNWDFQKLTPKFT